MTYSVNNIFEKVGQIWSRELGARSHRCIAACAKVNNMCKTWARGCIWSTTKMKKARGGV